MIDCNDVKVNVDLQLVTLGRRVAALTIIEARKPSRISKRFDLTDDGGLIKTSGGQLVLGVARLAELTPEGFVDLLRSLSPKQALTFGVTVHPEAIVVTRDSLVEVRAKRPDTPIVARDRENFGWRAGPGILMLDYDPPADGPPLTRQELLSVLYKVCPAIGHSPDVWCASASSCIHRTDTDAGLRGMMGQRVYVFVMDAQDIPRAGAVLFNRLWLWGYGRYDVSKSGALLDRSIIDAAVWQSERLDFAGGAHCGPGLEQRRPEPMVFNGDGDFLDTRAALLDLTPEEEARLERIKTELRKTKEPDQKTARSAWVEERLANCPPEAREKQRWMFRKAVEDNRLLGDFVLHSAKHGRVTAGTMLDNPDKYHGDRVADPLEPDYANDKRIAFVNLRAAGRPYIWSHAHGGVRYELHRAIEEIRIHGGDLPGISSARSN